MTDPNDPRKPLPPPSPAGQGLRLAGEVADTAEPSATPPAPPTPLDFAATLREYEPRLLRYAAHLLGEPPEVARGETRPGRVTQPGDLVQEAFLRLHRYCREHGRAAVAHPGTWLYRVVHNLAVDELRRRVRQRGARPKVEDAARRRAAEADDRDAAALGDLEHRELVALAMRLLGELPERQRQVITLKLLEGLTLRQIAAVLGTSAGSVDYHLGQGLARLAQQLKARGAG